MRSAFPERARQPTTIESRPKQEGERRLLRQDNAVSDATSGAPEWDRPSSSSWKGNSIGKANT